MHPRYQEWLDHAFNHPVARKEWYWTSDAGFEAEDPATIAALLDLTFTRSGSDLLRFTDAQVNQGLYYLASPGAGDFLNHLTSDAVPLDLRLKGIRSILSLYRDCFASRCTKALSHLDEEASPLNAICYMFWDLNTLSYLEQIPDREVIGGAIFSVLDSVLAIPHLACQEAALHGLGHLSHDDPEKVAAIVGRFLKTKIRNRDLRDYAEAAREGLVQ